MSDKGKSARLTGGRGTKSTGIDDALLEAEESRELARRRLQEIAGSGGLGDAEAMAVAEEAVRRARSEAPERGGESSAPPPEEEARA